jgi:hypothetical protein
MKDWLTSLAAAIALVVVVLLVVKETIPLVRALL